MDIECEMLVRSQKWGIFYWNLEEGEEGFLLLVVENLSELYPSVLWKAELVRNELGYLAWEISKQSIEAATWLIFVLYGKMREKEINWGKNYKPKGSRTSNLGNSQPIQIGKDAKNRRFTVRKEYSEEKAKGVTRQPFVNALKRSKGIHLHRGLFENFRHVTHESPQPSQWNPEIEVGSSRKNLWSLLSNEVNPCDIHWRPTRFLLILHQHKHCQLGLKGTEKTKWKQADRLPTFYRQETRWQNYSAANRIICQEKGRTTEREG